MAIIKSPSFARLSRIQQLGLCSLVFPGASHSRASHSIGVMHLAGRLSAHLGLKKKERRLLRVSGLLHDIGHYPLSHCIELAYRAIGDPDADPIQLLFEDSDSAGTQDEQSLLQEVASMRPSAGAAKDKAIGAQLVGRRSDIRRAVLENGGDEALLEDLRLVVSGQHTDQLYQQLLNSDYDCDRLDYVRRDSQTTGVGYGALDLDYLINALSLVTEPPTSPNRILVTDAAKGIAALEEYLLARYHMYSQVYFHKTVRALELVARAAFVGLARQGSVLQSYRSIEEIIEEEAFLSFDDSYFWHAIEEARLSSATGSELRPLVERLMNRRPLRTVLDYRTLSSPDGDARYRMLRKLGLHRGALEVVAAEARVSADAVIVDVVPPIDLAPGPVEVPADQMQAYLDEHDAGLNRPKDLARSIQLAPRIRRPDGSVKLMTASPGSVLGQLVGKQLLMVRVYTTAEDDGARDRIRRAVESWSA